MESLVMYRMRVKYSLSNKIFSVGAFAVLTAIAAYLTLSYNGFCWEDGGFLSQEEKKIYAMGYILEHYPPVLGFHGNVGNGERSFYKRPDKPIRYRSIEEFFRINPNCCSVVEKGYKGFEPSVASKLTGSISSFVKVDFKVRYLDDKGKISSKQHTMYLAISNCGHVWSGI
jgi:hypothetical protein